MMLEILIAVASGITAGIFTGLIPGIHVNLVAALLLASSPALLAITSPLPLAAFIVSLATTHSFLDFIPSTFLGVPDSGTELAVLPAHGMVIVGKGRDAVVLSLVGSLLCLVIAVCFVPFLLVVVPILYEAIKSVVGFILLALVLFLIGRDWRGGRSLVIFLLAGILGITVFQLPTLDNPLFPLLSGLFGVSILALSIKDNTTIPNQNENRVSLGPARTFLPSLLSATAAGTFTSIFPGLGAAQGAALTQSVYKCEDNKKFIVLVGGINTVNFVLSLVTLSTMGKSRNGAVAAISVLMETSISEMWLLIGCAMVAGGLATPLALQLTSVFCKYIPRAPYKMLVFTVIGLIISLTIILSGWIGIIVLTTSTALGVLTASINVPKQHQMGCLILPVLIYFLL